MKVPVTWRDTPLLPIEPARVLLDRGPHFFRRKREAGSQAVLDAGDVHAYQDASDIEDDGAELRGCHGLFVLCAGGGGGAPVTKLLTRAMVGDDGGQEGNNDSEGNNAVAARTDNRNRPPHRVAAENHGADPNNPSKNVEGQVAGVRHLRRTGDGRAERSNDGNEARENDGPAAILFVEVVGALKMAAPEEERVFAAVESCTCRAADPIADLIAHDGAKHDGQEKPLQGDHAGSGEDTGGNQQGITRKKKSHKKTGFDEDDRANERRAAGANQLLESVRVIEGVEKVKDGVEHSVLFLAAEG